MKKILVVTLMIALLLPVCIFATGGSEKKSGSQGKLSTINVAVPALPETLEPADTISTAMYKVSYNIFNNLIEYDFKGDKGLVPALAESWKYIDGKTLEVVLRKGVKFHNGDELTSEDVAWTFNERLYGNNTPISRSKVGGYWSLLDKVQVVDKYTVRFITKETDPVMPNRLTLPAFQIVSKRAFNEAKSFEEWKFNPVGTGPYKAKQLIPGDQLVLEAHKDFWGGKPNTDILIFRSVPETSARIAGLIAGDYQFISDVPTDAIKTIEADKNLTIEGGPSASFLTIYFNIHKPYMDVELRQAMSMAIDRDLIIKTLFSGRTRVPNGLQDPGYGPMYVKDHPFPKYDLNKAKELVKKSKYNGEIINYPIQNDYYPNEVSVTQAMVEMWKAAGINVQLEVKENSGQINLEGPDKIRLLAIRNTSHQDLYGDPSGCLWRTYTPAYDAQRFYNWKGPDVDEFNNHGKILDTSADQKERYASAKRMLEIYDANPPAMILYQNMVFSAKRKNLDWSAYKQVYMYFGPENFKQ
ncbi:MAG: ABC transporter substrate-binding protein [Spirochaetaceae bacterium]|nr:ABC transporter substrate-binding protein [Spirochaetaceae bacterium]